MASTTVDVQEFAASVKHAGVASDALHLTVAAAGGLVTVTGVGDFFHAVAATPADGDVFCAQINLRKAVQAAKSWKVKGSASLVFEGESLTLQQGDWCSSIPARRADEDCPPLPVPAKVSHLPAKPFADAVAVAAVASDDKQTIPAFGGIRFNGGDVSCTDRYRAGVVRNAAPGLSGDVTVAAAKKLGAALRPMCKAGTVAVAADDSGLYVEAGGFRLLARPARGVLPDIEKIWSREQVWLFKCAVAGLGEALGVHVGAEHVTLTPGDGVIRLTSDAGASTVPATLVEGELGLGATVSVKFARDMVRAARSGSLQLGHAAKVLQAVFESGGLHMIAEVKI